MLWNHLDLFNTRRRFLLVLWAKPGATALGRKHNMLYLHMARWMFGWPMACNCSVTRASNLCALASWKLITTVHIWAALSFVRILITGADISGAWNRKILGHVQLVVVGPLSFRPDLVTEDRGKKSSSYLKLNCEEIPPIDSLGIPNHQSSPQRVELVMGWDFFTVAVNVYPCIGVSGAWAIIEECREIDKQRRRPPG